MLAHSLLMLPSTKRHKGKKAIRSGSETTVARHFGGGALHLSDGGSFGGTELPKRSKSKKAGAVGRRPDEARGSLAGSTSSPASLFRTGHHRCRLSFKGERKRGRFNCVGRAFVCGARTSCPPACAARSIPSEEACSRYALRRTGCPRSGTRSLPAIGTDHITARTLSSF
jgi:hypothetical protein